MVLPKDLKTKAQLKRLRTSEIRAALINEPKQLSKRVVRLSAKNDVQQTKASSDDGAKGSEAGNINKTLQKPDLSEQRRNQPQLPKPVHVAPVRSRLLKRTPIRSSQPTISPAATILRGPHLPKLKFRSPASLLSRKRASRNIRGKRPKFPGLTRTVARRRQRTRAEDDLKLNLRPIKELQRLLGLADGDEADAKGKQIEDVTLVSLDLEWETQGVVERITEIGLSWLRVRDVIGTDPGAWLRDWKEKMEHVHIVTTASSSPTVSLSTALFTESRYMSSSAARALLINTLNALQNLESSSLSLSSLFPPIKRPASNIILVGQSLRSDILQLKRDSTFQLDLLAAPPSSPSSPASSDLVFEGPNIRVFDSHHLGTEARRAGVRFESYRLAGIATRLGIDPKYRIQGASDEPDLINWHNASNDAAYSLLAVLLFGTRWFDLGVRKKAGAKERERVELCDFVWAKTGRRVQGEWGVGEVEGRRLLGASDWIKDEASIRRSHIVYGDTRGQGFDGSMRGVKVRKKIERANMDPVKVVWRWLKAWCQGSRG